MTCHRLARLFGQASIMIESLVAITIEGIAQCRDWALLEHAKFPAARIAAMRREYAALPPLCIAPEVLDGGERFFFLSYLLPATRMPLAERNTYLIRQECGSISSENSHFKPILDAVGEAEIDWDTVLRMGNALFDRQAEAFRKPLYADRVRAVNDIEDELRRMRKAIQDTKSLKALSKADLQKVASKWIGQVYMTLLMPANSAFQGAMTRIAMTSDLTKIALALAEYHADRGSYPSALANLTPKYLPEVPKDIFNSDADLHYAVEGNGYLLYSIGPNGKDDGGKGANDRKSGNEPWDDLVVRMPIAKP
jgi:hypothetical protein